MIHSFDALALRQVGTRRLRALLTCFGIVLGVGMMFGVLLLVSTVRHTFDDLIDSAWGKTDLIVAGTAGRMSEKTVERVRSAPGVFEVAPWIGASFTRLDRGGHPQEGTGARMLVAAYRRGRTPSTCISWRAVACTAGRRSPSSATGPATATSIWGTRSPSPLRPAARA